MDEQTVVDDNLAIVMASAAIADQPLTHCVLIPLAMLRRSFTHDVFTITGPELATARRAHGVIDATT